MKKARLFCHSHLGTLGVSYRFSKRSILREFYFKFIINIHGISVEVCITSQCDSLVHNRNNIVCVLHTLWDNGYLKSFFYSLFCIYYVPSDAFYPNICTKTVMWSGTWTYIYLVSTLYIFRYIGTYIQLRKKEMYVDTRITLNNSHLMNL